MLTLVRQGNVAKDKGNIFCTRLVEQNKKLQWIIVNQFFSTIFLRFAYFYAYPLVGWIWKRIKFFRIYS